MMISDFRLMNLDEQASAVFRYGVFLCGRQRDLLDIKLHQIEGFYIEVYIHQNTHRIVGISSFMSTDDLEPYFHKIDISALLQPF